MSLERVRASAIAVLSVLVGEESTSALNQPVRWLPVARKDL
jgi:hypothetical protein